MPKIIIREKDNTTAGLSAYSNFTVVVPGLVAGGVPATGDDLPTFDENGLCEFTSQSVFAKTIGLQKLPDAAEAATKGKGAKSVALLSEADDPRASGSMGDQIAYELLGLGYTVLYKKITSTEELNTSEWCEPLKDKATYDFRYIVTGLRSKNTAANNEISKLASARNLVDSGEDVGNTIPGRGDCIALVDIDEEKYASEKTQSKAITAIQTEVTALSGADKYTAIFTPTVCYNYTSTYFKNNKFPASFHYLVCAADAKANNFAEWYAVAGLTRGRSSSFIIDKADLVLGEIAINTLEPRNNSNGTDKSVNVIARIKGNYYLWGNRTAHGLAAKDAGDLVASHFLNIRQLCTTIKKQLYIACRRFTFDPNSDILWNNVVNAIKPTLNIMKNDQGIQSYTITKVPTDIKGMFKAKITITPIEAVEDFDIDLVLEDAATGTAAEVSE